MFTTEELTARLNEIRFLPDTPERSVAAAELVTACDAIDDENLQVQSRILLMNSYFHGNEAMKCLPILADLLSRLERRPDLFDDEDLVEVAWNFKSSGLAVTNVPTTSAAQIERFHDDLEQHFRQGGHTQRPVHAVRFRHALQRGEAAQAAEFLEKWRMTEGGPLADCEGCDPLQELRWAVNTG
ncbi:hypothetical protein, partial [Corynebacterium nasicanis]